MAQPQCPTCYTPLETREVTPCAVCGGWPSAVARFDPAAEHREWRLPNGQTLILCRGCELEEFMVPGGWGFRFGLRAGRSPIDALHLIRTTPAPVVSKDQFCPQCNLRLAFLNVVSGLTE